MKLKRLKHVSVFYLFLNLHKCTDKISQVFGVWGYFMIICLFFYVVLSYVGSIVGCVVYLFVMCVGAGYTGA